MAEEMSRDELRDWLLARGVQFARGVHIDEMRRLYTLHRQVADVPFREPSGDLEERFEVSASGAMPEVQGVVDLGTTELEKQLDAELRILEKRRRVAELRRELAGLNEANVEYRFEKPKFDDIQHLVPPFSGAESYDANKWLRDFERACDSVYGDEVFRLRSVRRMMKPNTEGELFLHADSSATYAEFRRNFLKNFGHEYSVSEIIESLKNTPYDSEQLSVMGYVLKMQGIAARAAVDEKQTVRCIIEGFRDSSVNIAVLYPAQTLDHLKELVHEYAYLRKKSNKMVSTVKPVTTGTDGRKWKDQTNATEVNKAPLCFNCSGRGHLAASCPQPKRKIGSCFRCGSLAHQLRNCPEPAPARGQVALIDGSSGSETERRDAVDEVDKYFSEMNMVSVAFIGSETHNSNVFLSLFDSGSPISLIRQADVPIGGVKSRLQYSGFKGLSSYRLYTFGKIKMEVLFRNITKIIYVYVVENDCIPCPLLLGQNFLKEFNIKFTILHSVMEETIKNQKLKTSDLLHCVFPKPIVPLHFMDSGKICSDDSDKPDNLEHVDFRPPDIFSIALDDINIQYDINPNLHKSERDALTNVISKNYSDFDKIPAVDHNYQMQIRLSSDKPISFPPRRLSYADRHVVDKNVNELLRLGFIRPSSSPYSFPLVLVKKKDGTKRQCVDYRALNGIMIRDSYPLPIIDDCLERLEGKKVFSTLDLKNGFHHIRIAEDSIKYTAFVTPSGQYEYLRMPFGMKNGPGVFQRFMHFVLKKFIDEGSVVVYLDDITIATNTVAEHIELLREVLYCLAQFRLELNVKKCRFAYFDISWLGFFINCQGIRPSDRHVKAIKTMDYPKNVVELQRYWGLFSFFRRFIPGFSSISAPLLALTKANAKFDFNDKHREIFDFLRDKLVSTPVLALYSPNKETELHCDASAVGFGGILMQKQSDGIFHPVAYFSRGTTPAESRYHSYELETLAIIYSLRKFRIYLEGIPFKILTDCNSLAMTLNGRSVNARIARWALELSNYDYSIQHRSGRLMGHVDCLSRQPSVLIKNYDDTTQVIGVVCPEDLNLQLIVTQKRDNAISTLRDDLEKGDVANFALEDGLVYRVTKSGRLLFYVPHEMESNVIRQVHEKMCHLGVKKCVDQLRLHYWFPFMESKVDRFIKNCVDCIVNSVPPHAHHRTLHHIPKVPIPFDTLHLDHFGPLPAISSKRKHILLIVDAFTKYSKLFAVNSTSTKEVCLCLNRYFEFYNRPRRIITDRGPCFTSLTFSSYLVENNIEHVKVATASAQANGQVERVNRVLKAMLAKISEPVEHSDWSKFLVQIEYALNNSIHSVTKHSPSELVFGVRQRGPKVDVLSESLEQKHGSITRQLEELREDASTNIQTYQQKSLEYHTSKFKPHEQFQVGDYVVIRNVDTTVGSNKKLIAKYKGPYEIYKVLPNDRYVVRDIEGAQKSQIPFDGILEACRIRHWADWRVHDCTCEPRR